LSLSTAEGWISLAGPGQQLGVNAVALRTLELWVLGVSSFGGNGLGGQNR